MGIQARASKAPDLEKALLVAELIDDDDAELKDHSRAHRCRPHLRVLRSLAPLLLVLAYFHLEFPFPKPAPTPTPRFIQEGIEQCKVLARPPPNPKRVDASRKVSDRFVAGTGDVWLRNGTVWTGEKDGEEILYGASVLLSGGVIKKIGDADEVAALAKDADVVNLEGAWLTPGIVDLHSHLAVDAAPSLEGADDTNSLKDAVLPWLRSLDAFNTHDAAFNSSIAGGITTMLVLPGSAGNIGGQAFVFKPRWTYENTPESMQVESPFVIRNGTWARTHAWRHLKHACGENPHRVYGNTRMDSAYDFRRAYTKGQELKDAQDRWCASPATQTEPLPQSLEWEALADAIRGHVKVNVHCYETTDLNQIVRLSNEFQFPIAAFHHAHETYLVPDLLKEAWGPPPAVAIFATNARYKREAYRGSEFAPKILADAGLNVVMKSDHPVLDSRYLVYEAAQAHHYGLNVSHALGSVTTHSARAMGMDHRLGYIRPGYDADVVVWDSFPLALGATPKQTYIDGIPQIIKPHVVDKPAAAQEISPAGEYDDEAAEAVAARGDPYLWPKKTTKSVIFQGVDNLFLGTVNTLDAKNSTVVVTNGEISCVGDCALVLADVADYDLVDLKGGSLTPGLATVGSFLGVMEIRQEKSTWDGYAYDPLKDQSLLSGSLIRAADGIHFGSKDELLALRSGVTTAIVSPISRTFLSGLSVVFSTGAHHALEEGAIVERAAALHVQLDMGGLGTSTKIALMRQLLLGEKGEGEVKAAFEAVRSGERRLVVVVNKADVIASVVALKKEVAPDAKITILGGAEAWMVADDLADENIGVIVSPARSFPSDWDSRRIMPGPPLSHHTLPSYLASRGVTVALGIVEEWQARNTRYDAAWAYASSPDVFSKQDAIDLVSANVEELLGIEPSAAAGADRSWVAFEGDVFGFDGRVRAVRSKGAKEVALF
ncbi:hypothetical protein Q5752_004627 [Cryptotrichosporon argae]